eukprot:1818308-Rhodomonas_salina.2
MIQDRGWGVRVSALVFRSPQGRELPIRQVVVVVRQLVRVARNHFHSRLRSFYRAVEHPGVMVCSRQPQRNPTRFQTARVGQDETDMRALACELVERLRQFGVENTHPLSSWS